MHRANLKGKPSGLKNYSHILVFLLECHPQVLGRRLDLSRATSHGVAQRMPVRSGTTVWKSHLKVVSMGPALESFNLGATSSAKWSATWSGTCEVLRLNQQWHQHNKYQQYLPALSLLVINHGFNQLCNHHLQVSTAITHDEFNTIDFITCLILINHQS